MKQMMRTPAVGGLCMGFLAVLLAACGGGGSGGGGPSGGPGPDPAPVETPPGGNGDCEDAERSYDSTFAGIQEQIFERHGCTADACHGSAAQGGLDLRAQASYANLLEKASTSSSFPRITPGDEERSYLWLKLAAATRPDAGIQIAGAAMPNGLPPISEDELELMRLWIYGGAPQHETVPGTEELLGACLPDPEPITIKPLDPPATGQGIQIVMPEWRLPAASEHEVCFAAYYDVSSQVPEEFQDPSGQLFRFRGTELRQDPQSHHLIVNYAPIGVDQLHDSSFGSWTCKGGAREGETCEPTDLNACGDGLCASDFKDGFACIGFGPAGAGRNFFPIGGAQQAQSSTTYADGVFAQIPVRGLLFFNSHAFNLTTSDHMMRARLNYYFAPADQQVHPLQGIFNTSMIFSANAAPFTKQTICNNHVLPQGARLFNLSSHTHKHGKDFTIDLLDGTRLYESFVYNDPVSKVFDPPLEFDSPNVNERTLKYCSLYNNGLKEDGSKDVDLVTRASRVPTSAQQTLGRCSPVACVNDGMVGEPCKGVNDNASCDTSPGAGDGFCDACNITGGESTENEMFILQGQYYVDNQHTADAQQLGSAASGGRSDSTEIAPPQVPTCGSSAGGHAMHMGG